MSVPVFITYRDRKSMLARSLISLLERGFDDITVIDNDSLVPPALPPSVKLVHADNSHRQLAPWMLDLVPTDSYYIVMDGDIELDCPPDVESYLIEALETFPQIEKLGLGIRTDDFLFPPPEHYSYSYLMEYSVEHRYRDLRHGLTAPVSEYLKTGRIIDAPIDTHFAMHRPGSGWSGIVGARTTAPYLCRHLPWYNAEHSVEERLYYSRAGKPWTLGHSAGVLLETNVAVPFKSLAEETVVALRDAEVAPVNYAPMVTDESYWELLRDLWAMGNPFVIVEQDIVINETTIDELKVCEFDWCAMPFPYRGNDRAYALACTRFSAALIARHPDLIEVIGERSDVKHPPRHWCRLDAWIFEELSRLGEIRHEHSRSTPLGHIGAQLPSHGCLVGLGELPHGEAHDARH